MANISQEILSSAGFKNLASKAPADSLDKEGVTEVRQSAKQEIEELKAALATNGQNAVLNEYFKDPTARKALLDLIDEVEKNPPQATPAAAVATPAATASAPAVATPASAEIPKDVKDLIASIT